MEAKNSLIASGQAKNPEFLHVYYCNNCEFYHLGHYFVKEAPNCGCQHNALKHDTFDVQFFKGCLECVCASSREQVFIVAIKKKNNAVVALRAYIEKVNAERKENRNSPTSAC